MAIKIEYNNKNIVMHELIGLKVRVSSSLDASQNGICGTVVYETKNMLHIATTKGIKKVTKKISTFKFVYGKRNYIVDGREICFRPYERIEKSLKFYNRRNL
jgi:ribonuclease P protein subunit POP4